MEHFDKQQKADILTTALEERYESIRVIRERIQSICLWSLGLMSGAGGWLIQSDIVLSPTQKFLGAAGVLVAFVALRFYYLEDLYKGFQSQQRTAVRIEKALGLFSEGVYDDEKGSVYPEGWLSAGTEKGEGRFFRSTYALLYIGVAFLIITLIFHCGEQSDFYWHGGADFWYL